MHLHLLFCSLISYLVKVFPEETTSIAEFMLHLFNKHIWDEICNRRNYQSCCQDDHAMLVKDYYLSKGGYDEDSHHYH